MLPMIASVHVCRRELGMYRAMTKVQWNLDAEPPEISGCILIFINQLVEIIGFG